MGARSNAAAANLKGGSLSRRPVAHLAAHFNGRVFERRGLPPLGKARDGVPS